MRYLEHRRIRNKDERTALSVHVRDCACDDIEAFDVK